MKRIYLTILLSLIMLPAVVEAQSKSNRSNFSRGAQIMDRVTRVRDGDTIVVGLIPVRIANLDCPELGTRGGELAKRVAQTILENELVTCELEGRRSYDREVGLCTLSGGADFGKIMIAERVCERWRRR